MPNFFSSENIGGLGARFTALDTIQKTLIGTAGGLSLVLLIFLLIPTGGSPTYAVDA